MVMLMQEQDENLKSHENKVFVGDRRISKDELELLDTKFAGVLDGYSFKDIVDKMENDISNFRFTQSQLDNREFILKVQWFYYLAFLRVDERYFHDEEFVQLILDPEIIEELAYEEDSYDFPAGFKKNPKIMLALLELNDQWISHCDISLINNPEFISVCISKGIDTAIKYDKKFGSDKQSMIDFIKNKDGWGYEYCSDSLKNDPEIIEAALSRGAEAANYLDPKCFGQNDRLLELAEKNGFYSNKSRDPKHVMYRLRQNGCSSEGELNYIGKHVGVPNELHDLITMYCSAFSVDLHEKYKEIIAENEKIKEELAEQKEINKAILKTQQQMLLQLQMINGKNHNNNGFSTDNSGDSRSQ